jgi:predicted dehydrogenase
MNAAPIPLRVAVVGGGRVASAVHLPLIRLNPSVFSLTAIVETDPDRAATLRGEYPDTLLTSSLDDAFEAGLDCLICATPWPAHRDVILAALLERVPVLTEKPVSLDPAEIDQLIAAEAISGADVSVGYMKRHDPAAERFADAVVAHLDSAIRIRVDIVDPDGPRQIEHRLAEPFTPSARTRAASAEAVRRILGPHQPEGRYAVYGRGLGGSLVHQINLVHAALRGSGLELLGRLAYAVHWAEATSISCGWWPQDGLAVQMTHVRAEANEAYREVVEVITRERTITLTAASPYLLEQPMAFTEQKPGGAASRFRASPSDHGFGRQLRRWAEAIRDPGAPRLPSLLEARRDLAVVREAALAATGPGACADADDLTEEAEADAPPDRRIPGFLFRTDLWWLPRVPAGPRRVAGPRRGRRPG